MLTVQSVTAGAVFLKNDPTETRFALGLLTFVAGLDPSADYALTASEL